MSAPRIQRWQGILETMGLGSAHIETSDYSKRRKRKVGDVDAATSHATVGGHVAQSGFETCSITVPALLAMMKERKAQGKREMCPAAKCEELQCWNYFLDSRTEPLSCCGAQPRSKDAKFSDWHGRGWPRLRNLTHGFLAQQTG